MIKREKKRKNKSYRLKAFPFLACCVILLSSAFAAGQTVFQTHSIMLPQERKPDQVNPSYEKKQQQKSVILTQEEAAPILQQPEEEPVSAPAREQKASYSEHMLEIDGHKWMVHPELSIQPPSMKPEETGTVSIKVEKQKHLLTLYSDNTAIAQYTVGLASQYKDGAKQIKGDKRNPEGEYEICVLNDSSKFYLALGLNYPNATDAKRGLEAGLISQTEYEEILFELGRGGTPNWYTSLGGQIMIHGQKGNLGGQADWTTGCVAVDNDVMDILWKYCSVGTKVTILP